MTQSRSVIVLVIDQLRASALGAYGAPWCETPAFDQLAAESFVFDHAHSLSLSLAEICSASWQGLHPLQPDSQNADSSLIAQAHRQGLATRLVTDDPVVANHLAAADFDEIIHLPESDRSIQVAKPEDSQLAFFFAEAIAQLEQFAKNQEKPYLLWLHCRGLAGPWDAPQQYRTALADEEDPEPPSGAIVPSETLAKDYDPDYLLGITQAYSGQIRLLDQCMAAWHDALQQCAKQKTLFLLTAARGFPLGEHREVGFENQKLYNEATHVPLMVRFPNRFGALVRSQSLVCLQDLPRTLGDWLFGPQETKDSPLAASLLPVVEEAAQTVHPALFFAASDGQRAIRTPTWYWRTTATAPNDLSTTELFVKPDDLWEANEVADRCPQIDALFSRLQQQAELGISAGELASLAEIDPLLQEPAE